jgi:hypothetical protein
MNANQENRQALCSFFEALADQDRLTILGLLNGQEYHMDGLVEVMGLQEPAITQHLSKLRQVGLVNLRSVGNQRRYTLNDYSLKQWKKMVMRLESINTKTESSQQWINELPLDDFDKKVIKDNTSDGRLRQIPEKHKKLMAVLRWIVMAFRPGVIYAEHEVNALMMAYNEDYATLRRELINNGFLQRTSDGSRYWLTPENAAV